MGSKHILVTGGTGFLGSALVRRLVEAGNSVRVFDNSFRGHTGRLEPVLNDVELVSGDVRDAEAVAAAANGVDAIHHLAFINGTEYFYSDPTLVLEVGVKGILNVIDACKRCGIGELIVASSSEVYQSPPRIPTDEAVPLVVPDPYNPRYSYGGGKIISELIAINYGREFLDRLLIFRPHNVYGPDMGWEHVIPQFVTRMVRALEIKRHVDFQIQGTGRETRAFIHIEDFSDALMLVIGNGEHMNTYHIGSEEEVTIGALAQRIGSCLGTEVNVLPGALAEGSTSRRCPDTGKIQALGYPGAAPMESRLSGVVAWYRDNIGSSPCSP